MDSLECDCAVVDDPQEVCPKHQEFLWRHVHDLEAKLSLAEKALKDIATSAPCCEGHKSFNSPSVSCDQKIATDALSQIKQAKTD